MTRTITRDELGAATKEYAGQVGKEVSTSDNGGFVIMPGDILVGLQDGRPTCNDEETLKNIIEILMDLPQEPARAPQKPNLPARATNTRVAQKGGQITRPTGSVLSKEDVLTYLCPKATEKEAIMAVNICKSRGMDPWSGDVHFIKYGDSPLTIVAGKEHFTKKAEANPSFDGFRAGIIVRHKDGLFDELEGTFYDDKSDTLVGGWAEVRRKDRSMPFVQKVRLSAFDTGKALWSKMPEVMIRKCALVNTLREAFPGELGGIYDASEMGQAIDVDFSEVGGA